jgi:hypothetical protein
MWIRQVKAAKAKLAAGEGDPQFLNSKVILAKFFVERMLPDTAAHLAKIKGGADTLMALPAEAF